VEIDQLQTMPKRDEFNEVHIHRHVVHCLEDGSGNFSQWGSEQLYPVKPWVFCLCYQFHGNSRGPQSRERK
jgi:hypothetical protein